MKLRGRRPLTTDVPLFLGTAKIAGFSLFFGGLPSVVSGLVAKK